MNSNNAAWEQEFADLLWVTRAKSASIPASTNAVLPRKKDFNEVLILSKISCCLTFVQFQRRFEDLIYLKLQQYDFCTTDDKDDG